MPDELTQAVEAAVEQTPQAVETPVETPVVDTAPETPAVETPPPAGPSPEEVEKAMNIYKALNDPNVAPHVVKMMAEQLGIQMPQEKPQETSKAPTAADILKASLGPDYEFLAPKIAAGLEQYLETAIAPLRHQVAQTRAQNEFEIALQKVDRDTKGEFTKLQPDIVKLMDVVKPAPGVSTEQYLKTLYKLAKSDSKPTVSASTVINKLQRNAQENLPSPSAATENRIIRGPSLPTVEEAVAAALRNERFEG